MLFFLLHPTNLLLLLSTAVNIRSASAFGIGTALVNSGVADAIATGLVSVGEALGIGGKLKFSTYCC